MMDRKNTTMATNHEMLPSIPPTKSALQRSIMLHWSLYRMALLMILSAFLQLDCVSAFATTFTCPRFGVTPQQQQQQKHQQKQQQQQQLHSTRSLIIAHARFSPLARDESSAAGHTTNTASWLDAKGKEVRVGSIVRVVVDHLKAYQVTVAGQGSFGPDDKKFIPAAPGGARGTKNLSLPVGIRGVVSKIYDVDDVSANHPIQVKFFPGKHVDEGYDPPVPFVMHFSPEEIELV